MDKSQSTSSHTEGPWKIIDNATRGRLNIVGGSVEFIDPMSGRKGTRPDDIATIFIRHNDSEKLANARLIAAAPELLEACQSILRDARSSGTIGTTPAWIIDTLKSAVAKAN